MISIKDKVLTPLEYRGVKIDKSFVMQKSAELERKGANTFYKNFLKNRVHPKYNMRGVSQRVYTENPNIQGIDKELRPCILPYEPDQYLYVVDFKQFEFVLYVDLIRHKTLVPLINSGYDYFKMLGERGGIPRNIAKRYVYGYMYGAGTAKIREILGISQDKQFVLWDILHETLNDKNKNKNLFNHVPYINKATRIRSILGRELNVDPLDYRILNYYLQSSVSDLTFYALYCLYCRGLSDRLVLFLHDSFVFSLKDIREELAINKELDKLSKCCKSGIKIKYSKLRGKRGEGYNEHRMEQIQ